MRLAFNPLHAQDGRLRNGWWIALFLGLLAVMLFPAILISDRYGYELGIWEQGALILIATWLCQRWRRRPLSEVTGPIDRLWARDLVIGIGLGCALMAVPALVMWAFGWVRFETSGVDAGRFAVAVLIMAGVAIAEELLFRGFLFQRLVAGVGEWVAQVALAGLFLLTHFDNEGMHGTAAVFAGVNIFLAGLMFGVAWLATRRLALPIGLHFGANAFQGSVLGFAVSGTGGDSWLRAHPGPFADWLTGGSVGIEGSAVGLLCVIAMTAGLYLWRRRLST